MAKNYNYDNDEAINEQLYSMATSPFASAPSYGQAGYIPSTPTLFQQEGITKWLQSSKEIKKEIELKLRGVEYNRHEKRFEQIRPAIISEYGISLIMTTLDFHINKTVTLSKFTEDNVKIMCMNIMIALISALQQFWVKFGLYKESLPKSSSLPGMNIIILQNDTIMITKDHTVLRQIIPTFDHAKYNLILANLNDIIYATMMRAENGGERNFLTKITTEQIQSIKRDSIDQRQDGGMFSKLTGFPGLFKK